MIAIPSGRRRLTGARAVAKLADLSSCDVVLTSLSNDDALAAVALGAGALAAVLAPGAVHISTSTVSPGVSRRVAEAQRAADRNMSPRPCSETRISLANESCSCSSEARTTRSRRFVHCSSAWPSACSSSAQIRALQI